VPDTGAEAVKPDPGYSWEGHSRGVGAGNERDVREEQHLIYVARTNNNRVTATCDLYCCLLP